MNQGTRSFDRSQAESYLDRRFRDQEGYVALGFQDARKGWFRQECRLQWPKDKERILNLCRLQTAQHNVFICPVLRASEDRNKYNGLGGFSAFCDLDGSQVPEQYLPLFDVVSSGTPGHSHIYLNLSEFTYPFTIEELNWALTQAFDGDAKWSNDSFLRLPGTLNHKNIDNPTPVEVLQTAPEFPLEAIKHLLDNYKPTKSQVPTHPTAAEVESLQFEKVPELSNYLTTRLYEEVGSDRSRQSYSFITSCAEEGLSLNQVYTLAKHHKPTLAKFGNRAGMIERQVIYLWNKSVAASQEFLGGMAQW